MIGAPTNVPRPWCWTSSPSSMRCASPAGWCRGRPGARGDLGLARQPGVRWPPAGHDALPEERRDLVVQRLGSVARSSSVRSALMSIIRADHGSSRAPRRRPARTSRGTSTPSRSTFHIAPVRNDRLGSRRWPGIPGAGSSRSGSPTVQRRIVGLDLVGDRDAFDDALGADEVEDGAQVRHVEATARSMRRRRRDRKPSVDDQESVAVAERRDGGELGVEDARRLHAGHGSGPGSRRNASDGMTSRRVTHRTAARAANRAASIGAA